MKKLIFAATALLLAMTGCKQSQTSNVAPAIPADPEIEKNVQNWIKKMTLEEKVGQMLELNLDLFGANIVVNEAKVDRNKLKAILKQYNQGNPEEIDAVLAMTDQEISERFAPYGLDIYEGSVERKWVLDEAKLEEVISKYKVGSILNAPGHALTPEHWSEIIPKINEISMKHLGIPCIFGLDNNHGVTYVAGGTLFPQSINVAASFNTDLAYMASEICAAESRAADCPWVYNPTIDLGRDPRWSRIWESYGEDAIVTSRMVEAAVRGYQGPDNNHIDGRHVATSVKHYFAYGAPWSGKDRTPAYVSPQLLREKYFEPFKCAIQAGAMTIMVNSASINGVPVHASSEYLTKWLKEDLNWDGMIVTDWADINNLFQREKVAKDKKDAIRLAINAGIDMSMDPYSVDFCILLKELVEEGQVPMSRIDDAVRRILRLKYRLGLFDAPDTHAADYPKFGCAEFAEKSLHAAEESEVLLKNEGVLPIAQGKKILVTGPNANQIRCLNGGWSYTWQGTNDPKYTEPYNTIYEALANMPEFVSNGKFLSSYNQDEFNENASVSSGIVDGKKVYVDSVMTPRNKLMEKIGLLNAEDSVYHVVVPTEAGWNKAMKKAMDAFVFPKNNPKADSLQRLYAYRALMDNAVFSQTVQASINDSVKSKFYNSYYPQYSVFYKPFDNDGIFGKAKNKITCSNGYIYATDEWNFDPAMTYQPTIEVEGESTSLITNYKLCSYLPVMVAHSGLSRSRVLQILPETGRSNWSITYKVQNVVSGEYDVKLTAYPKRFLGYDTELPCRFTATINYIDENGNEQQYQCNDGQPFTTDPFKMDVISLARFKFPACNYDQTSGQVSITLTCSIKSSENMFYDREFWLDNIVFEPVKEK